MSKFYIADLHLGHENVIKHDGRPFSDAAEMHAVLVRNWNNAVGYDDEVYILGDFAWKNAEGLTALDELNGRKFLIIGNHDKPTEEMKSRFEWIKEHAVIRDGGDEVVLCHYPIAHWYNQYRGAVHLYGHVHNNADYHAFKRYADICRGMDIPFECYNAGCMLDYMGYTPRTLEEIRRENRIYNDKLIKIGDFKQEYNQILNTSLPCFKIMQSAGLIKHISKRHSSCVQYLDKVSDILENPDYIGINPKEHESIELVKVYDNNILIAIKLDCDNGYYYLASLYNISSGKMENRLNSGRLQGNSIYFFIN